MLALKLWSWGTHGEPSKPCIKLVIGEAANSLAQHLLWVFRTQWLVIVATVGGLVKVRFAIGASLLHAYITSADCGHRGFLSQSHSSAFAVNNGNYYDDLDNNTLKSCQTSNGSFRHRDRPSTTTPLSLARYSAHLLLHPEDAAEYALTLRS